MTIKYLDSKRISALSSDTKPTNVETNSILVEKDTGKRYWYDGSAWTRDNFVPTEISGLKLWLDADDATTITESTSAIDQWNDKSGQGNHVSSSGSDRPTYVASSMNGKAVVKFDGVGDYLQRTTFTAGAITGEATSFIVFKSPTDGGGTAGTYIMDGGGSGNRTFFTSRTLAENDWQYPGGTGGTTDFGVDHICTILWKNATSSYLRIDGVDVLTGTAVAATWNGITLADHYTLGDPSSTDDLDEEIAEVLVYDTELSTGDRDSVETYLANKWGITI